MQETSRGTCPRGVERPNDDDEKQGENKEVEDVEEDVGHKEDGIALVIFYPSHPQSY